MGPQTIDDKLDVLQQLNPETHAIDVAETRDWLESLEDVLHSRGHQRVRRDPGRIADLRPEAGRGSAR